MRLAMKSVQVGFSVVALAWIQAAIAASLPEGVDLNLSGTSAYETNIGFAPDDASEREDITSRIEGEVSWRILSGASRSASLTFTPFYAGVWDLTDLSHYGASAGLSFSQQFGSRFSSPGMRLSITGTWLEFEDSEPRDGYTINADLAFGRRLGANFMAEIGARYHLREATNDDPEGTLDDRSSDEVWDNERIGGFATLTYNPTQSLSVFFEYSYMTGDIAATGDILTFQNPEKFDAVRDFAFDEGIRFQAWKIDVDQNTFVAGASYKLNDKLSLSVNFRYEDVNGEEGNDYSNMISTLGFSYGL